MAKRPKRMATFRLSEATLAAIKAIADEREMSQAEVIEWLIEDYGDEVNDAGQGEFAALEAYLYSVLTPEQIRTYLAIACTVLDRRAEAIERVQRAGKRATLREQAA